MNIILVTSGQPSLNPRLVKEADALAGAGYQVTVIYAYWNEWGTKMDEQLLKQKKWKAIRAAGDPKHEPIVYFFSRLLFKAAGVLSNKFKIAWLTDLAASRATFFLQAEAKKIKADIYIGHNLGALPAVAKAARKYSKAFGFDAEDMHRYEVNSIDNDPWTLLAASIENKYIPKSSYLSVSSPQIGAAYKKIFSGISPITILNVFPQSKISIIADKEDAAPVKLFWFSQTIGKGRGLEDVIETLLNLKDYAFELHLLGDLPAGDFKNYLDNAISNGLKIIIHPPIAPDNIPVFASAFDIGLATELSVPLNRDLCLTNKIFTYLQAGLAIIASNTTAQKDFLEEYRCIGKTYNLKDNKSISAIIISFYNDRQALSTTKKAALNLAHTTLNWETESLKFISLIEQTLRAAG